MIWWRSKCFFKRHSVKPLVNSLMKSKDWMETWNPKLWISSKKLVKSMKTSLFNWRLKLLLSKKLLKSSLKTWKTNLKVPSLMLSLKLLVIVTNLFNGWRPPKNSSTSNLLRRRDTSPKTSLPNGRTLKKQCSNHNIIGTEELLRKSSKPPLSSERALKAEWTNSEMNSKRTEINYRLL